MWLTNFSFRSTARLTKQLPFAVAMELMTTGTLLDAERAHQFGFINYLVDKGQVLGVAMKIARKIVANAPVAVQLTREAARLNVGRPDKEALAIELLVASPTGSKRTFKLFFLVCRQRNAFSRCHRGSAKLSGQTTTDVGKALSQSPVNEKKLCNWDRVN